VDTGRAANPHRQREDRPLAGQTAGVVGPAGSGVARPNGGHRSDQERGITSQDQGQAAAPPAAGFGWRVNGELPGYSISRGSDGWQGGVSAGPMRLGTDGSVGISGTVPILGPLGVQGSADFAPNWTTACLGPSVGVEGASISAQACYTLPVGYQPVIDAATDAAAPILAPLADPSTFMDPFVDYKQVPALRKKARGK
jgi:hypothetical protein